MACNSFGTIFKLTSFGESHGEAIGGIIDGMPSGIEIDIDFVQKELNRRRPGQSVVTTSRKEKDTIHFLSGLKNNVTTGCPIAFIVNNTNQQSRDYEELKNVFRPSHADFTYQQKYNIRDERGGGRSSARITIARCVAGALAKIVLNKLNINITAFVSRVGSVSLPYPYTYYNLSSIEENDIRCPECSEKEQMRSVILEAKEAGDTVGGAITCVIKGCSSGLGEPEFGKLHAQLGAAMLSINAVKGFEYGSGFEGTKQRGSQQNDSFVMKNGKIITQTNNSGGIQGGISNGQDIYFNVAFKPVATLLQPQQTVNMQGENISFTAKGRHDPCVLPRAVPIVEAMAAMVILDNYLINKASRL